MPAQYSHFASYPSSYQSSESCCNQFLRQMANSNSHRLHGTVYECGTTASPRSSQSPAFKLRTFIRDQFSHDRKQPSDIATSNFTRQRASCIPSAGCSRSVRPVGGRRTRQLRLRCRSFTRRARPIYRRLCNVCNSPSETKKPITDGKVADKIHIPQALTAWVTRKCLVAIYLLRPAATDHIMP